MGYQIFRILTTFAVFAAASAYAEERIPSFHSDIVVFQDGSLVVTETIRVKAEGNDIKRGIYRDFPTEYRDDAGDIVRVSFNVLQVARDGAPEPFHTEWGGNGVRVYIGQESVFLTPREYTYTLTYRTMGQLGFFENHDEVYWNVNGTGWIFPIDRVTATVQLPGAIPESEMTVEGYTGFQGDTGKDYRAEISGPSAAHFTSTRPFQAGENLTIVVTFPKGHVSEETYRSGVQISTPTRLGEYIVAAGAAAALLYFLVVWALVGRDPAPGRILPQERPPEGYSPAALRYVRRMGADAKVFSVALVNMAVKGYIAIDQHGDDYSVTRTQGSYARLADEEEAILGTLFSGRTRIDLKQHNHHVIGAAKTALETALKARLKGEYFRRNGGFFVVGLLIMIVSAIVGSAGRAGAFGDPINTWLFWAALAAMLVITVLFFILLRRPTLKGRALLDQLEGFRMHLNGEGTSPFSASADAAQLADRFEQFLPYAIALDAAAPWAEGFTRALSASGELPRQHYRPLWYTAPNWNLNSLPTFVSSLSSSFSGAVASSASPPGSSSGSGGGGSSGGGGGGGGGGGW